MGVKIELIIRGICCIRPGIPNISENITVTSIVGRFLEHARIFWFHHNGENRLYLSSADMMTRNMVKRVEILFPVYAMAMEMANWYHLPTEKLAVAALLHDCGRKVDVENSVAQASAWGLVVDDVERRQPILLHQKLGAYLAKQEYGVEDKEILEAIATHTSGGKGMSKMATWACHWLHWFSCWRWRELLHWHRLLF